VLVAKVIDAKRREIFAQVVMVVRVRFDNRDGWVLLAGPLDLPAHRRELSWMHPDDSMFVWVRRFRFALESPCGHRG
jgi:hypothetical protein